MKKHVAPSLDNARQHYAAEKAEVYEEKRARKIKWRLEYDCLASLLKQVRGSVLDVPVGTGRFLQMYKDLGLKAVGIDYNEAMLQQARARHPDVVLLQGDVTMLQYPSSAFDTVVCIRLLHLISPDEVPLVMRELLRVARQHVIVTVYLHDVAYSNSRLQAHTFGTLLSCARPPWELAKSMRVMRGNGKLSLGEYYMLHFRRAHAVG